ncbi:MAG: beta-N-acetylhexosaminidase [Pseudomonadota bacterium]
MTGGQVFVDIDGLGLTPDDAAVLAHPRVGGLILFARNFESTEQLEQLMRSIRSAAPPSLVVAVDHEGGRVQRFHGDFTRLPPVRTLGHCFDEDEARAVEVATHFGWILAAELGCFDIDLNFGPVLDLDHGVSEIIGHRSFHRDPAAVSQLALAMIVGMRKGGMAAVGKHFPGHGGVRGDTHDEAVIDPRAFSELSRDDLSVYAVPRRPHIDAVMCSHVTHPDVDSQPAGFSRIWLQRILREQLAFTGAILSDDLTMAAAAQDRAPDDRVALAFEAGCDAALMCNDRAAVAAVLSALNEPPAIEPSRRLSRLRRSGEAVSLAALQNSDLHREAVDAISTLARFEPQVEK